MSLKFLTGSMRGTFDPQAVAMVEETTDEGDRILRLPTPEEMEKLQEEWASRSVPVVPSVKP